MKKIILSVATCLFMGLTAVNAQDAVSNVKASENEAVQVEQKEDKVSITEEELPTSIQEKLATSDFNEWEFKNAFVIKKEEGEVYEVTMNNGTENATHRFNKEGKKVD